MVGYVSIDAKGCGKILSVDAPKQASFWMLTKHIIRVDLCGVSGKKSSTLCY